MGRGVSPGDKVAGVITTHLRLVPRVRMSGAMPLLSPYVFRTWIGTSLTFTFRNMDKLTVNPLVRS